LVSEARARAAAAKSALERAERLIADEAISQRELEDARREREVAGQAVEAARRAAALYTGASAANASALRLTAPIAGTLVDVRATPGATVTPGELLFRVIAARELWITARVPEQDAARLRSDRDASFRVAGLEQWQPITIRGADAPAVLVNVGRTVDAVSRTVDVIYALRTPDAALRVGGQVQVQLPAGDDFRGVTIAKRALVDQEGRDVVYVQVDGEHFVERPVRVAVRSGELAGIASGLAAGERVVVEGAHLVRLADRARGGEAHGHIH
jgi:RND family efflux transporter MFP subunit